MVKQLRLPSIKLRPTDQLQRVIILEELLVPGLLRVRLAQNLVRVDAQLRVSRPPCSSMATLIICNEAFLRTASIRCNSTLMSNCLGQRASLRYDGIKIISVCEGA